MKKIKAWLTKQNIIIGTIVIVIIAAIMHLGGWRYLNSIFSSRAGGPDIVSENGVVKIAKDISKFEKPNQCSRFYPWGAPIVNDAEVNARSLYLCRTSYASQYDPKIKVPLWEVEILQNSNMVPFNIPSSFVPSLDMDLPDNIQASLNEYKTNKYEFGYLASIRNMYVHNESMPIEQSEQVNSLALKESLYITNAVPMTRAAYNMIKTIENQTLEIIKERSPLYLVSGPVFLNGKTNGFIGTGENKLAIPTHIYKIITYPPRHGSVAYLIPNTASLPCGDNCTPEDFSVSIREVERVTGIQFFPELSNYYATQVKQDINEMFRKKAK